MSSDEENENEVVLPVPDSMSDGDETTWRLNDPQFKYRMIDDTRWRLALAQMWIEKTGAIETGKTYILEKLPEGYGLFDRPRGSNPSERDTFLFGHPSGFYFQSRVAFFPHFFWLMSNREGICQCANCARATKSTGPRIAGPRKRRTKAEMLLARGLPPSQTIQELNNKYPSDEEGPDYWRIHIMDLKEKGKIDEDIDHRLNMDWAVTHEQLADYFVSLTLQASFVPRRGEVVLWTPDLDGTLEYNTPAKCIQIKDKDGKWQGMPEWRAGIVTQVPEEECNFMDIIQLTKKKNDLITYSGFRVETLVDPLSDDKAYSYQYKYVPLKQIKPFGAYEQFLWPLAREKLHPSIEFALTTMASWSLLHYTKFKGDWPNAKIYCKGIWIGHELLAIKDAVRLKPPGLTADIMNDKFNTTKDERVTDVMVIEQIWLSLEGCIADPKDPNYATSYQPYVAGKVYTVDPNRLNRPIGFDRDELQQLTDNEVDTAFQYVGMQGYGPWYRIAGGRTCAVTKNMLLGRCYEPEAAYLHFGTFKDLGYDLHSMLSGRAFSAKADARVPEGVNWFWGDYRAETLGLAAMNGVEVGPAAEQRENMPRWQAILRILHDCMKVGDLKLAFKDPSDEEVRGPGRPPNKHFVASKFVNTGLAGLGQKDETSVDEETEDSIEGLSGNVSEVDLPKELLTASIPFR
ncbi:uncharacterized protein N7477_004013 [Penicillium maclennaniae]|uniref:uncharacterized protein n=1 Tax=Penicillium maclennaniae TaxID=1343394 RepID=UPI002540F5BA|nr:uncharacterized protein N7477_004013 [Penicillium maclennaniae]KAJ5678380.1 hypothetical protein N7477_004013 [Penicillium maclennaniae]